MACTGISPKSLGWCAGKTNLPGIRRRLYFIPKRDIVTWPTRPETDAADLSKIASYVGSFTLGATAKWGYIDVLTKKSPVTCESQGEYPSKTFINKGTFVHAGVEEEATAFAAAANNDDYVYIVETTNKKYRVLGNDLFETDTKPSLNFGQEGGADIGTTINVEVTDTCPAPFYVGEIITEDGTINPVTP